MVERSNQIKKLQIGGNNDESSLPTRKYSEAVVLKTFKPNVHQKVFEALGNQLTTLKLSRCSLNLSDIANILRATPNVKFLTFDYMRLKLLNDDSLSEDVELPQLQVASLLFNESDPSILAALQKSSTVKVCLHFNGDIPYSNLLKFVNFLNNQTSLNRLLVSGLYESNLFLFSMTTPTFQLEEFSIDNCDFEELEDLDDFLMERVETMENFIFKSVYWNHSTVINDCKKLESLQSIRIDSNFLRILMIVEELLIEPMRNRFRNVRKLCVCGATPSTFEAISRSLAKLEDPTLKFTGISDLNVPTLRKLKLASLTDLTVVNFYILHNKIKELLFEQVHIIDDALLESIIVNFRNRKVFRFFGENYDTSRAFQIIRDNYKSPKAFDMTSWDQKFNTEDWRCLYDISGLQAYQDVLI